LVTTRDRSMGTQTPSAPSTVGNAAAGMTRREIARQHHRLPLGGAKGSRGACDDEP
jgi:hypothetical protein